VDTVAILVAVAALAVAVVALLRGRARIRSPEVIALAESPRALRDGLATALRHVSVVRYDAFGDVSGRQSFTAAILDDNGDGLVITSLHARTESRTYLKGVRAGSGPDLSPEEREAVAHAAGDTR
jgi:hypothetical protein